MPPSPLEGQRLDLLVIKENGILGFGVVPRPGGGGVQVSTLHPNSSADRAGLRINDCLVLFNNEDVASMHLNNVVERLKSVRPGEAITLGVYRPAHHPKPIINLPVAKKPRVQFTEAAMKKQIDTLTKVLAVAEAEKAKLNERNATLRKRTQDMIIQSDEKLLGIKKEFELKITQLTQEKEKLARNLAALLAQERIQNRTVLDMNGNNEIKGQLEFCKAQLNEMIEAERKRKDARRQSIALQNKLINKHVVQMEKQIIQAVKTALESISKDRKESKSNAYGINPLSLASTFSISLELCRPAAVQHLFGSNITFDVNGFPMVSSINMTWSNDRVQAVFGKQLKYEERAGVEIVATGPVEVNYDPSTELLEMKWKWSEQSLIRKIGRSIRLA
ncbi:hypothetical protein THRCLA_10199 [Thraustotheca clavata]|uniref:PDZ domain-containing protein n=1 Tax=Thraustotheca clavata TaxID=74557 RepID=A0A1V9YSQ1_9STRA|nr:hypothetical protein THRCLA_10199 [Thraustotheca clavata]